MRSIQEITTDMRALAKMVGDAADEFDQFARQMTPAMSALEKFSQLTSGGKAFASPFAPSRGQEERDGPLAPRRPRASQSQNPTPEAKKLLARQLWFSASPELRTTELTRTIARRIEIPPQIVATIIRRTPKSASDSFSRSPEPSSSGARSTSSTS